MPFEFEAVKSSRNRVKFVGNYLGHHFDLTLVSRKGRIEISAFTLWQRERDIPNRILAAATVRAIRELGKQAGKEAVTHR